MTVPKVDTSVAVFEDTSAYQGIIETMSETSVVVFCKGSSKLALIYHENV